MRLLLRKVFGPTSSLESKEAAKTLQWEGDSLFQLKTTGASYYRDAILKITNLEPDKNAFFPCIAILSPEDDNPHDSSAIKVIIKGHKVGYLPRAFAAMYHAYFKKFSLPVQDVACEALITKGYYSNEATYEFAIELDIPKNPAPPKLRTHTTNKLKATSSDFNLNVFSDGTYHITAWLDHYAITDMHPKKRIHTWTTYDWDTVNYYLLNRKGTGLGHKLFAIAKPEHYRLFGNNTPLAEINKINGRLAYVTLIP